MDGFQIRATQRELNEAILDQILGLLAVMISNAETPT
jgi:hypothetical protein